MSSTANEGRGVALFIDWDNLAISTVADLGETSLDIKRIVRWAQRYGTIVLARAYSEWHVNSDRLQVYRAGVEPVYAPVFRFEADPITNASRGKSLADPCIVADCVDALHLYPTISVYIVVSGDKDLVPMVRLAQLRGKYVVVIGPDLAANILRNMADEFITYRELLADEKAKRPEEAGLEQPAREPRRVAPSAGVVPTSTEQTRSVAVRPSRARGRMKIVAAESPPVGPEQASGEGKAEEAPKERVAEGPDLQQVFTTITELLQRRATEGKHHVRATNLKDSLMLRIGGFSERQYGFSKFKDLLQEAEKAGVVSVRQAGPVHWVSLPPLAGTPPPPVETLPEKKEPITGPLSLPVETTSVTVAKAAEPAPISDERLAELVRFLLTLRQRSRWLTYTYVLTNLVGHLGQSMPPSEADADSKAILNYLMQQGIMRVDREAQEVEVGGIKHRVRMCHLEESHPLVAELLASAAPKEVAPVAAPIRADAEATATPAPSTALTPIEAVAASATEEAPAPSKLSEEVADGVEPSSNMEPGQKTLNAPSDPEGAFSALVTVLHRLIRPSHPRVRAANVKTALDRELGGFHEKDYGFSKFKQFLEAAEKAGRVKLQTSGSITWVLSTQTKEPPPNGQGPTPEDSRADSEDSS